VQLKLSPVVPVTIKFSKMRYLILILERVRRVKSFSTSHPIALLLYYMVVMIVTIFFIHPIVLLVSFLGSMALALTLKSWKQICKDLQFYLILFLIVVLTNPLFVHEGETVLFELRQQPITLEAILYGVFIAFMLISVINWSKMYSDMMTTDKFVYVFGKTIPKLSLILTMALRFIPLFIKQIKKISMTQRTFSVYPGNSIKHRILRGMQTFHIIITWSLENSVTQADAMKARGYGLEKRTNFAVFRWSFRDTIICFITVSLFLVVLYFNSKGDLTFQYYPRFERSVFRETNVFLWLAIGLLMLLPSLLEVKEQIKWKFVQSKM